MVNGGLCLFIFSCSFWITANCVPVVSDLLRVLTDADATTLLGACNSKGGCSSQDDKSKKNRAAVKISLTRNLGPGHSPPMSEQQAEQLLQGLQTVKAAFMTLNKLTGVVPYNNGLIQGDQVVKNQAEIDTLLGRLRSTLPSLNADLSLSNTLNSAPLVGGILGRRKRADSVSLDYYRGNKWPSNTVNVYIDSKIWSSSEASTIRQCLKSISTNVPCLKFVERNQEPFIDYVKVPAGTDPGTCGWAPVGYQKGQRNDVNLNFASSICQPTLKGVCIHETLHILGFGHEHTRNDRNEYMSINWKYVDPQATHDFDKDNPNDYNPYGVNYDELSIMHYDVYVGTIRRGLQTMTPTKRPHLASKIGNGNDMTSTDAKLLRRLYCSSSNCHDAGPNCGWRALKGECSSIKPSCQKSCGSCDG